MIVIPAKAGIHFCEQVVLRIYPDEQTQRNAVRRGDFQSPQRVAQHREKLVEGFTRKYGLARLVWFEAHENAESAITREKQIKKWNRLWKVELVEKTNPNWHDVYDEIL